MREELSSDKLKEIQLAILKEIDFFCRTNNIKYYLSYGTLLGAIRHQGFIPWDDDIDICMPREDYQIFLKKFVHSQYKVQDFSLDNNWPYAYGKVYDCRSSLIEITKNPYPDLGVNVDVFPFDNMSNNYFVRKFDNLFLSILKKIYLVKNLSLDIQRPGLQNNFIIIMQFCGKIFNNRNLINTIIKYATRHQKGNTIYFGCAVLGNGKKEEFKKEWYDKIKEHVFEDKNYYIPNNWDSALTNMFKDYMKLPPIEQQCPHHSFVAFNKK